jgi:hypothetical protein
MSKIITPAERAARRKGQPAPMPFSNPGTAVFPVAQFRVKGGCKTCKPIPVYAKAVPFSLESDKTTH